MLCTFPSQVSDLTCRGLDVHRLIVLAIGARQRRVTIWRGFAQGGVTVSFTDTAHRYRV
jgi:hypothetical protein